MLFEKVYVCLGMWKTQLQVSALPDIFSLFLSQTS